MWIYQLLKFFGWVLLALVVVVLLIAPSVFSVLLQSTEYSRQAIRWMESLEFVQSVLMHVLTMGWLFFLGGCLASFLNVVAWRVPRGRPITGSSHCPVCHNRLKFRDNMPFVGWLRNSGECGQCGSSISVRYLVAEILLGVIFLILASVVFLTGAANWPIEKILHPAGFEHLLFSPNWQVIQVLVWHLVLVCFLFTFVLIESDSLRVPVSIVVFAVAFACVVTALRSDVWLVLWRPPALTWQLGEVSKLDWALTFLLGGGIGFVIGRITQRATTSRVGQVSVQVEGMTLVGMFLGWQAAVAVGAMTLGVYLLRHVTFRATALGRMVTPAVCLLLATVAHLLLWSNFYSLPTALFR